MLAFVDMLVSFGQASSMWLQTEITTGVSVIERTCSCRQSTEQMYAHSGVAMSFGLAVDVDAPFPQLIERARTAELLGFGTVYVPDHSRPWRHEPEPGGIWFDGWTALTAFATATSTIRVGTLVTNPVLRPPGLVVREALAVDHLSAGRLQLGIGTGIAGFDHEATGTPYWPLAERVARFQEYVAFVDVALRSGGTSFEATGPFFTGRMTGLPAPVQTPRPPMTVAGASKGAGSRG